MITPLFRRVDEFNLSVLSVILFITTAVISSSLIKYLATPAGSEVRGLQLALMVPQLWATIPQHRRNGVFLVLILATAAYLSLASIIAIPSLKSENLPDAVAPDKLRTQLQEASLTEEQIGTQFPEQISGEPPDFTVLRNRTDPFSAFLLSYAAGQIRETSQLAADWGTLRQYYFGRQTELARAAVKTYELDNIGRKGSREQIQHFIDVDAWFRSWRSSAEAVLANCRSAVARVRQ